MLLVTTDRDFRILVAKIDHLAKELGIIMPEELHLIHMETAEMSTLADIKTKLDAQSTLLSDLADRIRASTDDPAALSAIADEIDQHNATIGQLDTATPVVTPPGTPPVVTPPNPPVTGALPVISQISPSAGMAAGGQTVSINGTNLGSVTAVTFGGVPAASVVPDHDNSLQVVTPPGSGQVDVVVTTPAGDSASVPFTFA